MGRTDHPVTSAERKPLPREIEHVLERTREILAAIIEAVSGGTPRAQDVTDDFAVHRKLGWQVWNIAYADEPLEAIRFMPNPRGIEVFRASAAQQGVPEELLARLDESVEQFQQIIRTHAGDRELLEMMVESGNARPDDSAEVRWRKQAFTGNSFIWGVRAKCLLATLMLHPSRKDGYFDMVRIHGLLELVRTRATVRWPFAQSVVQTKDGREHTPVRQPLMESPLVRDIGVPLMEPFCSQPLPAVQRRTGRSGMLEDELLPGPVGQTGASTVVTGEIVRQVAPITPSKPGQVALFGAGVRTPAEVFITDHFVHRDLFPAAERELRVFGEMISPTTQDERDCIPVADRIQHLGRGLARVRTAEVPQYADILGTALEKTGWAADDFDVYRVRMRYPPMPVAVMIRYEWPAEA